MKNQDAAITVLRAQGATVHHEKGTDNASVRLEAIMMFIPLEDVAKSIQELTLKATLGEITISDRILLEIYRESMIIG